MSVLKGIGAYKARKDEEEARRAAASRPKIQRFALHRDGDSAVVRFAQEIDPDAANYNAERGLGGINIEHNHPDPNVGWRNRANCSTESQGSCYACERVQDSTVEWADRKGWKQKEKFYVNVVAGAPVEVEVMQKGKKVLKNNTTDIDRKTGEGEVYLLEQGTFNGIYDALVAYQLDEDSGGTITNNFFKITRKGSLFNDTSYVLTPLKEIPADAKSLDDFELINIEEVVVREVPYAQQEAFYHKGLSPEPVDVKKELAQAVAGSSDKTGDSPGW